jgi:phospholipase B1
VQAHAGYFEELKRVAGLDKYKAREDFAVVVQPFLEDTQIPTGSDGKPDTSYLAPDCFHFSGTIVLNELLVLCGHWGLSMLN